MFLGENLRSDIDSNYWSLWDHILPVGQIVAYSDVQNRLVWSPNMKIIKWVGEKKKFKKKLKRLLFFWKSSVTFTHKHYPMIMALIS